MEACWRQNPSERPKAGEVLKRIEEIESTEIKNLEGPVSVKDRVARIHQKSENAKKDDLPIQTQIRTQKAKYPIVPTTVEEQKELCYNSSLVTATPLIYSISKNNTTVASAKYPLVSTKPTTIALPGLAEQKVPCEDSSLVTPPNIPVPSANCQDNPLTRDETQNARPQARVIKKLASTLVMTLENVYGKPPPEKKHNAPQGNSRTEGIANRKERRQSITDVVGNAVDMMSQTYFMPKT